MTLTSKYIKRLSLHHNEFQYVLNQIREMKNIMLKFRPI
jgi:hypothetical protein